MRRFLLLFMMQAGLPDAMREIAAGRFERAQAILEQAEKADPQNLEVAYRLGLVLLRAGKLGPAAERLERAVRLNPESPTAWLAVAQVRLKTGARVRAIEAAERARALAPAGTLRQALAVFFLDAQEPQRVLEIAQESLPLADRQGQAALHHLMAQAYALRRDPANAVRSFQEAIRLDPDQLQYYLPLAQFFFEHRTPEPGALVAEAAVRRFPESSEALRMLGLAYYAQGRNGQALEAFLKVLDRDPDREDVVASLETLLPEAGARMPEIIRKLQAFSARRPSSSLGYYLLALCQESGREALLRKAIQVSPGFWPAYFELHKVLKEQQKLAEAVQALERAVALNPEFAPAHYDLAQLYGALGDRTRARQERERHHQLLSAQRSAAEKRNAEMPRLSYELPRR